MTLTDPDTIEVDEDTAGIAARLTTLANARATIEAEEKELKRRLRAVATAGQRAVFHGQPLFTLQANRRFDINIALGLMTPSQITACQQITYDPKKVREQLPPVQAEKCMVEVGDPKVVLAS